VVTGLYNNRGSGVFCAAWSVPHLYKRDSLKERGEPREWGYSGVQRSTTEIRELELENWVEFQRVGSQR
jgi:hypothetical protein